MKRIFIHYCLLLVLICFPAAFVFAADNYTLYPMHTAVLWHINHFGFSNPSGKWMASDNLVLDEAKPNNSKVDAVIQVGDIVTGIPELDKHLRGPLFFDVKQFPTAKFVSDKVEKTSKKSAMVYGTLTLHGVSKPVKLLVMLNKIGKNPVSDKMSVGFTAVTKIKRSDFGIVTYLPGLSDEVIINIEAEANKQ